MSMNDLNFDDNTPVEILKRKLFSLQAVNTYGDDHFIPRERIVFAIIKIEELLKKKTK